MTAPALTDFWLGFAVATLTIPPAILLGAFALVNGWAWWAARHPANRKVLHLARCLDTKRNSR